MGRVHTSSEGECTTVTRGVRRGPSRHNALGRKLSPATVDIGGGGGGVERVGSEGM